MTEEEKVKKMVEFRTKLVKRIQNGETELEGLRVLLEFIDAALLEKGFKRAEIAIPAPPPRPQSVPAPPPPPADYEKVIPLKTVTGELLANLYGGVHSMRIVPAEDKEFNINTPPFIAFFVGRVLDKMQEKDREVAASGEISPDKIFSYQISQEGDIIKEILIQHITTDRSRELKSTIRWTLEKMYEKTMKSGS